MSEIPVPGYQALWTNARKTIKAEFQWLVGQHLEAEEQLKQLFKVLCDIEDVHCEHSGRKLRKLLESSLREDSIVPCMVTIRLPSTS
jgi:hypothetical protein